MHPGYLTPSVTARACCCPCQGCKVTFFLCREPREERVELLDFLGADIYTMPYETTLYDCYDLVHSDLTKGEKHWNRVDCTGAL